MRAELSGLFAEVLSLVDGFRTLWPGDDGATVLMELEMTTTQAAHPLPLAIILRALEPAPVIRDLRIYLNPALLRLGR